MPQVAASAAEPLGLGGEAEHALHHRERDSLGVGQVRRDPCRGPPWREMRRLLQQVVDFRRERGREGVQVGCHHQIVGSLALCGVCRDGPSVVSGDI